jgi:signal transduction histidine kinase
VSEDVEALRAEREQLAAALRTQAAQVAALQKELFETNKGVLALYAELEDQADQLRHVSDLKSRFLSYVSHEFRAPLASIRSIARLLLDRVDGSLTSEQEKQVLFVQTSAQELTEMVDDQLDLARIEAGRITISPEWFELVDLFAALRGMFRPILVRDTVRLTFVEPVDVPRVYTDHKKLAQILRNFIANGLKFTHRGEVRVTAARVDETVVFAVADTGIGIPRHLLSTLFQDFARVETVGHGRVHGTGLGLSLSKRLAALLGGTITVESCVDVGSTFHLQIPLRLPMAAAGSEPEPQHG